MTAAQRAMRDRYAALGFTIQDRAFAGTDQKKWYFMNRLDSDERRSDFSVNLDSGVSHQMGTNQLRTIDEAEAEYGQTGERQGVSPPCVTNAQQAQTQESQHGGLTPNRSPGTGKPAKKKQAALF
jgi:hypothetical protein